MHAPARHPMAFALLSVRALNHSECQLCLHRLFSNNDCFSLGHRFLLTFISYSFCPNTTVYPIPHLRHPRATAIGCTSSWRRRLWPDGYEPKTALLGTRRPCSSRTLNHTAQPVRRLQLLSVVALLETCPLCTNDNTRSDKPVQCCWF